MTVNAIDLPKSCATCHVEADDAELIVVDGRFEHRDGCPAPSVERIRRCIERQQCPICHRTRTIKGKPFRVIAVHAVQAHNLTADELRDLALVTKATSIAGDHRGASDAERERKRQAMIERRAWEQPKPPRRYSLAGEAVQLERVKTKMHPAALTPESIAKRAASQRRVHPCVVCQQDTGNKDRRTCGSATCIREAISRTFRRPRNCSGCDKPMSDSSRRTCSPECVKKSQQRAVARRFAAVNLPAR